MRLKVGGPSIAAAHEGQKVGGPRPARPNSFRRLWMGTIMAGVSSLDPPLCKPIGLVPAKSIRSEDVPFGGLKS